MGQKIADVHSFGIHPVVTPQRLFYSYQPLITYLNTQIETQNTQLQIETSADLDRYHSDINAGRFSFMTVNPYDIPLALNAGYRLLAYFGDEKGYGGILLTRKDSGIKQVADLRGKTICYPYATNLNATLLNQYFLWQQGLDVVHDVKHVYLNSYETVYLQVFQGKAAAGGSMIPGWNIFSKRLPDVANALKIKWRTNPLPGICILVRSDIPEKLVDKIRAMLLSMHQTPAGRSVLEKIGLPRFSPALHESYAEVERFLQDFQTNIGNPGFAGKE